MLFLATTKYVHVLTAAELHIYVRGVSSDRDSECDSDVL